MTSYRVVVYEYGVETVSTFPIESLETAKSVLRSFINILKIVGFECCPVPIQDDPVEYYCKLEPKKFYITIIEE